MKAELDSFMMLWELFDGISSDVSKHGVLVLYAKWGLHMIRTLMKTGPGKDRFSVLRDVLGFM